MRTQGALLVAVLALVASLTACSSDSTPSSAPSAAASPAVTTSPIAAEARACPPDTPEASSVAEAIVAGVPEAATFCDGSTGNSAAPPRGTALSPSRTFALLANTDAHPSYEPTYCSSWEPVGTAGILLSYPNDATRYVEIGTGDCATLNSGDDAYYLLTDDLEWLVRATGVDWLGANGERESTPPKPKVCPTRTPTPTALAPVLAKGVAVAAASCRYDDALSDEPQKHGVTEVILDPATTLRKLTAASKATADPDQACTMELDPPSALAFTYADGTRSTVYVSTSGCWEIVQKSRALPTAPADQRRIPLDDDSILGD